MTVAHDDLRSLIRKLSRPQRAALRMIAWSYSLFPGDASKASATRSRRATERVLIGLAVVEYYDIDGVQGLRPTTLGVAIVRSIDPKYAASFPDDPVEDIDVLART